MLLPFIATLVLISTGMFALAFFSRLRRLRVIAQSNAAMVVANRYRPMVRLLAEEDTAFVSSNKAIARKLRAQRRRIFRGYLDCLTKDYARLLNGVRLAMVRSGVDRPDLAQALAKNKFLFTFALCRIEFRLLLHRAGIGKVDVSGLVDAMDALRTQVSFLTPAPLVMAR
ncbi:MAG: hypothetical protein ABSB15_11490 [Bryobacteraceae bacterium]|jgi:hypothetical protein